ncbi:hypothetical protein BAY59_27775 [Prauserella coralliicola]|nr:hypothetical protein BAY59_27775 [Prauserella coralliicola]
MYRVLLPLRSVLRAVRKPPVLFDRRRSWACVKSSTETIAGCAGVRERTIRSGSERRNRTA